MNNVLVLAPHADDFELGCGGTISKLMRHGYNTHVIVFSLGNSKEEEIAKSTSLYEIDYTLYDFKTRFFQDYRQDILELLIWKHNDYDIIFTPCSHDIHQDHKTVHEESIRAYKRKTLLGYTLTWNCLTRDFSLYSEITKEDLDRKIQSVACYDSQSGKNYSDPSYISGLAVTNGVDAGYKYAEVFEVYRYMLKDGVLP